MVIYPTSKNLRRDVTHLGKGHTRIGRCTSRTPYGRFSMHDRSTTKRVPTPYDTSSESPRRDVSKVDLLGTDTAPTTAVETSSMDNRPSTGVWNSPSYTVILVQPRHDTHNTGHQHQTSATIRRIPSRHVRWPRVLWSPNNASIVLTLIPSNLCPKRNCGSKRVNNYVLPCSICLVVCDPGLLCTSLRPRIGTNTGAAGRRRVEKAFNVKNKHTDVTFSWLLPTKALLPVY